MWRGRSQSARVVVRNRTGSSSGNVSRSVRTDSRSKQELVDGVIVANLDGTGATNQGNPGGFLSRPFDIALDTQAGKMYIVSSFNSSLVVANLDGTGAVDRGDLGGLLDNPRGIALLPADTPTPTATATSTATMTATATATSTATRVPIGGSCTTNSDCEEGAACLDAVCSELAAPAPAATNGVIAVAVLVLLGIVAWRLRQSTSSL